MTTYASGQPLNDAMLGNFQGRAAGYDHDNRFFSEDFEDLRGAGYLKMVVPTRFGGAGLSLAEVCQQQRRLAYHAPATALATNMHLYWTGVAADLYRSGDLSLQWLLEEAAAGEVFAAGHAEAGNDLNPLYSTARAERVAGGYRVWGRKSFGSLAPVWTRLGLHATDASDPDHPKVIHAFLTRDTPGYRTEETWDTLGMRATRSDDTILEGAFIPDRHVARVLDPGFAGADQFIVSLFGWFEPSISHIYLGLAERACDLAIAAVQSRTSIAMDGHSLSHHPEIQHSVAEMILQLDGMRAHAEHVAQEWSEGVDHGGWWPAKLVAVKYHCVSGAQKVVDLALDLAGGSGIFRRNELERLYRDVRCGGFHPANSALTHEIIGKTALGVLGAEGPRWG